MSNTVPTLRDRVVDRPAPGEHVSHTYRDAEVLLDVVARYCRQGLVAAPSASREAAGTKS